MARIILGRGIQLRLLELDHRWREHHPRYPRVFLDEWNGAYRQLQVVPEGAPPSRRRGLEGARRLLLQESQYHVYYWYYPPPDDAVVIVDIRRTSQTLPL